MPTKACYINNHSLMEDNSASVLLGAYSLVANVIDNSYVQGPVPFFFARDKDAALAAIIQKTEATFNNIRRINMNILHMEHITLQISATFLKGLHWPGRGKLAYRYRPEVDQDTEPAPKKARPTNPELGASGIQSLYTYKYTDPSYFSHL